MGIKGLWKEIEGVCTRSHISEFRGLRLGVDAFCWLHRAAVASAVSIASGQPCDRYLAFFASRLELLLAHGIIPVLVFDGRAVPMKEGTNTERRQRRRQAREEGLALLAAGHREEGARALEKSVDVPHEMAHSALRLARERGIQCIVAPFEADAQLGYLCLRGVIRGVISEDSDLLVYRCPLLIAKLEGNGACECVRMRDVNASSSFAGLSPASFVLACILSGCDYVGSLPGIGIRKAMKVVHTYRTIDASLGALRDMRVVPEGDMEAYEDDVHRAFYCFSHHLVYDPTERRVVPFTPLPEPVGMEPSIVGAVMENAVAVGVCELHELSPSSAQPYPSDDLFSQCLELFWRRVRGAGQRPLTAFMPRPKQQQAETPRDAATDPRSGSCSPPLIESQDSDTVLGTWVPRAKDRPASGSTAPPAQTLVRSKYFAHGAAVRRERDDRDSTVDLTAPSQPPPRIGMTRMLAAPRQTVSAPHADQGPLNATAEVTPAAPTNTGTMVFADLLSQFQAQSVKSFRQYTGRHTHT